jgi:hypothetical protein
MHTHSPNKLKTFKQTLSTGQKAESSCFLGHKRNADCRIHATRDHNNVRSVLWNTGKLLGAIQNKRHGMLTYSVLVVLIHANVHPHTTVTLEHCWSILTGNCWPPSLQPWAYSGLLPPVYSYLPEELFAITALQQKWGVDGKCQNVAELTSLTQAYKILFFYTTSVSVLVVTALRSSLSMYIFFVYNNIFLLIACFVNSSLDITFWITLIFTRVHT